MHNRELLRRQRALLRLNQLARFEEFKTVNIPAIPKERTLFPGTKADYWQEIEIEGDFSSCLYELKDFFPTHRHKYSSEKIKIVSKNSRVEWVTEEGIFFYGTGDTFSVPKGMAHAMVNLCDFPVILEVDWCPVMIGFNADFKERENENS